MNPCNCLSALPVERRALPNCQLCCTHDKTRRNAALGTAFFVTYPFRCAYFCPIGPIQAFEKRHIHTSSGRMAFAMNEYVDDFVPEQHEDLQATFCDPIEEPEAYPQVAETKASPSPHPHYPFVAPLVVSQLTSDSWSPAAKSSLLQLHKDFDQLNVKLRLVFEQSRKSDPHPYKGKRSTHAFTIYRKHGLETRYSEPKSRNIAFGRRWPENLLHALRPHGAIPAAHSWPVRRETKWHRASHCWPAPRCAAWAIACRNSPKCSARKHSNL